MRANVCFAALMLCSCAVQVDPTASIGTRSDAIVGGSVDDGGLYPQSFYLRSDWNSGGPTACSSTLITPRVLLTAAHCVDVRKMAGATSVNVFANNISPHPNSADPSWVQVSAISIHPDYDPSDFRSDNDVALVLLPQASTLKPIPFNARDLSSGYTGAPITAVGWGLTTESGSDQGTRRSAQLTMRSITASHILLGDMASKGICNGDSGGPSLHLFTDGVARVVGVHEYTEPGATCMDGADVRVDSVKSFITQYLMTNEGATCDEDGLCKTGCTPVDIDCACQADGVCSAECPNLLSDPDCSPDCVSNSVCATADCPKPDPDCMPELAACTNASQCQHRECVTDSQRGDQYCTSSCADGGSCPSGTSCTAGVCTRTPLPAGSLGDVCTPGATFCLDDNACTGSFASSTHCEKPCTTMTNCAADQKCLPGYDGTKFCEVQPVADGGYDCLSGVTICQNATICTGPLDAGTYCAIACTKETDCGDTAHCVDGSGGKFCQSPALRLLLLGTSGGNVEPGSCSAAPGVLGLAALLFSTALRRRKRG